MPTALAALRSSSRQARRPSVQLRHFVEPLVTGIGRTDAPQRITKVEEVVTTEGFDAPGGQPRALPGILPGLSCQPREVSRQPRIQREAPRHNIIPLLSREYRPGSSSLVVRDGRTRTLEPAGGRVLFKLFLLRMLPVWLYNPRTWKHEDEKSKTD